MQRMRAQGKPCALRLTKAAASVVGRHKRAFPATSTQGSRPAPPPPGHPRPCSRKRIERAVRCTHEDTRRARTSAPNCPAATSAAAHCRLRSGPSPPLRSSGPAHVLPIAEARLWSAPHSGQGCATTVSRSICRQAGRDEAAMAGDASAKRGIHTHSPQEVPHSKPVHIYLMVPRKKHTYQNSIAPHPGPS